MWTSYGWYKALRYIFKLKSDPILYERLVLNQATDSLEKPERMIVAIKNIVKGKTRLSEYDNPKERRIFFKGLKKNPSWDKNAERKGTTTPMLSISIIDEKITRKDKQIKGAIYFLSI